MKDLFNRLRFLPLMEEDGGGGAGTGGTGGTDPNSGGAGTNNNEPPKTFTQEELNRIAAQEKRQGMSSVLKALGFEKEEDAKAFVEKYRKEENDKKDDLTKAQESLATANTAKAQAEARATQLEMKFKAVSAGVPANAADDVVLLASTKMTDGKTFEDALEEVKKAYPSFFEAGSEGSNGTGGVANNPNRNRNKGKEAGGIGKRLAEQKNTSSEASKKQSYFSN